MLLLYGAGLRRGEVLRLSVADVDLPNSLLTIRNTKFFKSRLVPISPDLTKVLSDYARWRAATHPSAGDDQSLLPQQTGRSGSPLHIGEMPSSDCGNMPACDAPMAVASNLGCTTFGTPSRSTA